jgi:drug/metabolite transporter (DMT)-like permease
MKSSVFQSPTGDRPMFAMVLLLIGVFVLALQDSLVKLMSDQTSFWQFQTLRSIGNLCFAALLAYSSGNLRLIIPKKKKAVFLRAGFMTICMFCFFSGAPFLSVPQMAAGLYTYPLFVSLLAAPVLGEKVGPWRIGALIIGSCGALLVLSPWREEFTLLQMLPVCAGLFFAANILTIRKACREESPLALASAVSLTFLGTGLVAITLLALFPAPKALEDSMPFIAIGWPNLTMIVLGFAIFASVLNLTGNICLGRAYQTADSSWLAPLDFSYLLLAAIWSKLLFDVWPTGIAIAGMSLIAAAGILTGWRERISATKT